MLNEAVARYIAEHASPRLTQSVEQMISSLHTNDAKQALHVSHTAPSQQGSLARTQPRVLAMMAAQHHHKHGFLRPIVACQPHPCTAST
jgi:hypothetical protein